MFDKANVEAREMGKAEVMRRLFVAGLIAGSSWARAMQPNAAESAAPPLRESYGGIVVNQTITVGGQEFFQYFMATWRDRELSERYAISITERPSARWGSQIWIEFERRRVFQAPLPTARLGIRALSEQAAEVVLQTVADMEVERLLFREPDLAPDEL